jgi:hypothetical protein
MKNWKRALENYWILRNGIRIKIVEIIDDDILITENDGPLTERKQVWKRVKA